MVAIADKVASKLEEKKGSITEDEVNTVNAQFLHQHINQLPGHLIQWGDGGGFDLLVLALVLYLP